MSGDDCDTAALQHRAYEVARGMKQPN